MTTSATPRGDFDCGDAKKLVEVKFYDVIAHENTRLRKLASARVFHVTVPFCCFYAVSGTWNRFRDFEVSLDNGVGSTIRGELGKLKTQ